MPAQTLTFDNGEGGVMKTKGVKEVILTNGKKIRINLVAGYPKQTFVRMRKNLVVGIVQGRGATWPRINVWKDRNGVYQLLGDLTLKEQPGGLELCTIFACPPSTEADLKRAVEILREQGELHASELCLGRVMFLSFLF